MRIRKTLIESIWSYGINYGARLGHPKSAFKNHKNPSGRPNNTIQEDRQIPTTKAKIKRPARNYISTTFHKHGNESGIRLNGSPKVPRKLKTSVLQT